MMRQSLKQLRLARSKKFHAFCDNILAHEGKFSKPIIRKIENYRRLFTAVLNDDDYREMAAADLKRLTVIEIYVAEMNKNTFLRTLK